MATIKLVKSIYTGSDVTALGELATGDTVNLPDGSQLNSQNILTSADVGSTVQAYDATLLNDADIGVSVQAYDATLLNDADIGVSVHPYDATLLNDADIGVNVQPYDATLLNDADIGVNVQAYDSSILKSSDIGVSVQAYDATLLNDADIGVNVQAYDATILKSADIGVTVQAYDANALSSSDIGVTVQGYDATLLKLSDIGVSVQAYDADNTTASNTQTLTNKTIDYNSNTILNLPSAAAGGLSYVVKTSSYTTQNLEGVLANTSGGAFTVTLPASPSIGDQVVVADPTGDWSTNNLTVGRNGETISGVAQDLVCDIGGVSVQLVYDGSDWNVYAQVGGNTGTFVTEDGEQTLTNKTIAYADNTITGVVPTSDIGVSVQAYDADTAKLDVAQTFTAAQTFGASVVETKVAMGANDIDLSAGNYFTYTLSGAQTLTVSNVASSGSVSAFVLEVTNGGSDTVTWFSGITWNGGTAPTLTEAGVDTLAFFTYDGGTTWRGFVVGQAMA